MAHNDINSNFPSQVVSDNEKGSREYGLKIAKAIEQEWFNKDHNNNKYISNLNNFHKLRLYARGEQSIQKYKDELSINGEHIHKTHMVLVRELNTWKIYYLICVLKK